MREGEPEKKYKTLVKKIQNICKKMQNICKKAGTEFIEFEYKYTN